MQNLNSSSDIKTVTLTKKNIKKKREKDNESTNENMHNEQSIKSTEKNIILNNNNSKGEKLSNAFNEETVKTDNKAEVLKIKSGIRDSKTKSNAKAEKNVEVAKTKKNVEIAKTESNVGSCSNLIKKNCFLSDKITEDKNVKDTANFKLNNSLENCYSNKKNDVKEEKTKYIYPSNAELVTESLDFQKKLNLWKGTEISLKEKKKDEQKIQEQRYINIKNVKLGQQLSKEENLLHELYLEQIKKDEELAIQIEHELNAEARKELNKIEQDDYKYATIIQNSANIDGVCLENSNNSYNSDKVNNRKVSKINLFKEKIKRIFRK